MSKKIKITLFVIFLAVVVACVIGLIIYYRDLLKVPFKIGSTVPESSISVENPAEYIPEGNPMKGAELNPLEDVKVNPFRE